MAIAQALQFPFPGIRQVKPASRWIESEKTKAFQRKLTRDRWLPHWKMTNPKNEGNLPDDEKQGRMGKAGVTI
jgi:hypothetical protein